MAGLFLALGLQTAAAEKEVYIPNDFKNDPVMKQWSWEKSYQSDNFVVFWGDLVGEDPQHSADPDLQFDPKEICGILETCYEKFVGEIGFVDDSVRENLGKYKIVIVMNETWEGGGPTGWAFGAAYDDTIGAMWVHPNATRDGGAISHEFGHALQNMVSIQGSDGSGFIGFEPAGSFWESHTQFMRTQMYPERAGEDMPRWMATAHFHLSSTRHHYCAFRWLMHLQRTDGIELINRIWSESRQNEHPLETLKRLKKWDQDDLNDFIYDYAIRNVVFDYPVNGFGDVFRAQMERLEQNEPHSLWRRYTILDAVDADRGHYRVPDAFAPQDYGYNIIPLHLSGRSRTVQIQFAGIDGIHGNEGWRYGFVIVDDGGQPRYSRCASEPKRDISVQLKPREQLYLVVVGAPRTHHSYVWEPGWPKIDRFPYELIIDGAVPEGFQDDFRERYHVDGHRHPNGKGWVADSASVDKSVFVGPRAIVRGNSRITGEVRIEGAAWVENVQIRGHVTVSGNARIYGGSVSGDAVITDNAVLTHCTVSDRAEVRDNALAWNATYSGDVVVGGDSEIERGASGVYLQCPHGNNGRTAEDGLGADHESNQDVNQV